MRGTDYIFVILMIAVFMGLVIMGANEMNKIYPDNPIDTANLTGYDYSGKVMVQVNATYENFRTLGDDEKSWFQKIGAGIVAIPYAVITFPIMVAEAIYALSKMISNGLGGIVPPFILLIGISFLTIEAVRRFLEFFQRARA